VLEVAAYAQKIKEIVPLSSFEANHRKASGSSLLVPLWVRISIVKAGLVKAGAMMTTATIRQTTSIHKPVLVLNRNWQPINVATVARSLVMLWNESAKIVDPVDFRLYDWSDWSQLVPDRDEPFIQAVRQRIRIPEVIALSHFDAMPTQTVTFNRRNVFKRDKMTCQYCG
jgi:hypothetical protein